MPYSNMAQALIVAAVGIDETPENRLKTASRISYYSGKFWELIRNERLRPPTNPDGSIVFSSNLYRRLYNTCRVPGEVKDEIQEYFKTAAEGDCPGVGIIIGRGRVFSFEFFVNGQVISPQEFLHIFTIARDTIENASIVPGIPILTSDDRASWARNRKHLIELSADNANRLKVVESAAMTICFDDTEPTDYSEIAQQTLNGGYHSRWNDKTSAMVSFKNGRVGLVAEHSAFDGTISISFSSFILFSLLEEPEPDWEELPRIRNIPKEIKFQIDDHLRQEISKMDQHSQTAINSVIAVCQQFEGYGKAFMKQHKIHPDSFVQMGLQWAYYKMHQSFAPTYETATMRVFYHGRTETVRSCSVEVKDWIKTMTNPNSTVSLVNPPVFPTYN